jgi:phenylpropionate dioxygenase-like ring-hydroxylating dioxygenase large terminal subunit
MDHETQVSILKELFRQLDSNVNVDAGEQLRNPASVYTSHDIAEKEWQQLFRQHPQIIGISGDLPESGNYLTLDDFGAPILATRDAGGRFRAFLNACSHRGARVAGERRGIRARFTCPFHAWTYSGEGELLRVPRSEDFGELDKRCHGLRELPAVEADGLLWVHPDPCGHLDAGGLPGKLGREISGLGVGEVLYQAESTIDMGLNWKLANDTFGETYHFSRLHHDTLGQLFHGDILSYQTFGQNHRFVIASRDIDDLRGRPESEWRVLDGTLVVYYLFPNVQLTVSRLGANLVRIYPDGINPGRSISRISYYLRPEVAQALARADSPVVDASNTYDYEARHGNQMIAPAATMEIFRSTIEQEDYAMGVDTQRAAESGLLTHLLFGRNEPALHHFHRCFSQALDLPPPEVIATASGLRAASG